jgi:hypothetical protein
MFQPNLKNPSSKLTIVSSHTKPDASTKRLGHFLICTQTAVRRCVVPTTIGLLFLVADQADVALLRPTTAGD